MNIDHIYCCWVSVYVWWGVGVGSGLDGRGKSQSLIPEVLQLLGSPHSPTCADEDPLSEAFK